MKKIELNSSVINTGRQPKVEPKIEKAVLQDVTNVGTNKPETTPQPKIKKPSIFKRMAEKYRSLSLFKKLLATGLLCIIVVGGGGAATYLYIFRGRTTSELIIPTQVSAEPRAALNFIQTITAPIPSQPKDTPNPINGELYTAKQMDEMKQRFPIAVMIENHVDARPQSGFNEADLVFETLAEGGITRMMGIFWGRKVNELGPVRSARQYYIEWLMPFDPLYMHIGYAQSDDPRTNAGGSIWEYNIKDMDIYGSFWRSDDRYAPHNAYTSSDTLYQLAAEVGYTGTPKEITPWKFKKDAALDSRGARTIATLTFYQDLWNGGLYDVTWTYDRVRNIYLRSMVADGTEPYIDQVTGQQVYAKNIIIQRVNFENTFDEKGHVIITTIGQGDAIILRDGLAINATWKKDDIYSRTKYFDSQGEEIEFNRGVTWVEGVPIEQGAVQIAN